MVESTTAQMSSPGVLDKDVEIHSSHSDSDDHGGEEKDGRFLSMTDKGDIEAYPDAINATYDEAKEGPVTRTNTKSSWKDPGPPPDGGVGAWTQGM